MSIARLMMVDKHLGGMQLHGAGISDKKLTNLQNINNKDLESSVALYTHGGLPRSRKK